MSDKFDTAAWFDEIIVDMLDGWDKVAPQDAVELAEIVHAVNVRRRADGREPVALPLTVERRLIECAKRGMQRGQGRKGRPRKSYAEELLREAIVSLAKERKDDLVATGMRATGTNSAEDRAAEEASERYGLNVAATTIKRLMQSDGKSRFIAED